MAIVIDAANVVGSRPDGWWRDRAGATARLLSQLCAAMRAGALAAPVVVVLEGAARAAASAGDWPGAPGRAALRVVHAESDGDTAVVAEVNRLVEAREEAVVVTADRALGARVRAANGTVLPPSWLLDRLV